MASMREIKTRIKSIKETRQITNAMKLISAVKLKRAKIQLERTLPFFNRVKSTMADIIIHSGNIESQYFDLRSTKPGKKKGYLILSGDQTLAGGYNNNLIKAAEGAVKSSPDSVLFIAGAVGKHYFIKKGYNVVDSFDYPIQSPSIFRAREIAEYLLEMFKNGDLDEIYIIYTLLETSFTMKPVTMKLLPLDMDTIRSELDISAETTEPELNGGLLYEPSPAAVFEVLIPKYIKSIIYGALTEAFTSEQSSRMYAMDSATANADKMLHNLSLIYNRARQSAITQEISEIIGGAEVLK